MVTGGAGRVGTVRVPAIIPETAGWFVLEGVTEVKTGGVTLLTEPHFYNLSLDCLVRGNRGKPRVSTTQRVRSRQTSWLTDSIVEKIIDIL